MAHDKRLDGLHVKVELQLAGATWKALRRFVELNRHLDDDETIGLELDPGDDIWGLAEFIPGNQVIDDGT